MTEEIIPASASEMIDLMFDLDGGTLPSAYPFALWMALVGPLPEVAQEKYAGVLPLRGTEHNGQMLLPKRAKLVLRIPTTLADHAAKRLSSSTVQSGAVSLALGKCKPRAIQPSPTLHAQLVTGPDDELIFMGGIATQLNEMNISAKLICGKHHTLADNQRSIGGYSLVVHDLKAEASLKLQYAGLGEARRFGCGIFVPHKVISGLSED